MTQPCGRPPRGRSHLAPRLLIPGHVRTPGERRHMSYNHPQGRPSAFLAEIASYLTAVRQHSLLTRAEEQRLARLARAGDESCAQALVAANLRFVVKVCCGYRRYGLPIEDLVQEGNI